VESSRTSHKDRFSRSMFPSEAVDSTTFANVRLPAEVPRYVAEAAPALEGSDWRTCAGTRAEWLERRVDGSGDEPRIWSRVGVANLRDPRSTVSGRGEHPMEALMISTRTAPSLLTKTLKIAPLMCSAAPA